MATAYGYVKRDPETTQLNWAQIATDLNDTLQAEVKKREEKKAAIDEASRQYQKILNDVPQGENTQLNQFATKASESLQQQMLMQETLLKSGQISPRQYTLMRQNLTDGTDQAFSLLQDYNDEYSRKMAAMDQNLPVSERLSKMDSWMMEQTEGFANFMETELVINPQTGIMSLAKLVDNGNGEMIPDMKNLASVQQLQNRIKGTKNQYDVIGGADKYIKALGEQEKIIRTIGGKYQADIFTKINNIREKAGGLADLSDADLQKYADEIGMDKADLKAYSLFEKSQNSFIDGEMSNPNAAGSILVDFLGQLPDGREFDMTFNAEDVFIDPDNPDLGRKPDTENLIYMEQSAGKQTPVLSDEQKALAKDAYKSQIDIGLDYKESVQVNQVFKEKRAPTQTEINAGNKKDTQKSMFSNVAKLYYGSAQEIKEAENFLRSTNPNIIGIDRSGEDVIIEYKDGKRETVPFASADGGTQTQEQWVKGAANYFLTNENKITNVDKVASQSGVDFSKTLNTTDSVVTVGEEEVENYIDPASNEVITMDEAAKLAINSSTPNAYDLFSYDKEEQSAGKVNAYLAGTGYSVSTNWDGSDELIVNYNGNPTGVIFNLDKSTSPDFTKYKKALQELKYKSLSTEDKALMAKKFKKTQKQSKNLRDNPNNNNQGNNSGPNTSKY